MGNLTIEWKPETIIVEPSRLQNGLWGYEEGDISQSYSADVYGQEKAIRQPFIHNFSSYVAMSVHGQAKFLQARAYPIIHESYCETILNEFEKTGQTRKAYTGKNVTYHRQQCIFGLPVIFKQRVYSGEERVDLLRRMYAYGGWFASNAESYTNFLLAEIDKETLKFHVSAIQDELVYAKEHQLKTQEHVQEWIACHNDRTPEVTQLELL